MENFIIDRPSTYAKDREILCIDAVKWLEDFQSDFKGSIFTGLPDLSELLSIFSGKTLNEKAEEYEAWFLYVLELIFKRLSEGHFAIFYQTDTKVTTSQGVVVKWIDKSYLCSSAASRYNCALCWHKIASNYESSIQTNRPKYSHILCFSKGEIKYHTSAFDVPDVIDRGLMNWPNAIGLEACILCIAFLKYVANSNLIYNPFCGRGTVVAVANYFGIRCIGIEILPKRCRKCLTKNMSTFIESIPEDVLQRLGVKSIFK